MSREPQPSAPNVVLVGAQFEAGRRQFAVDCDEPGPPDLVVALAKDATGSQIVVPDEGAQPCRHVAPEKRHDLAFEQQTVLGGKVEDLAVRLVEVDGHPRMSLVSPTSAPRGRNRRYVPGWGSELVSTTSKSRPVSW